MWQSIGDTVVTHLDIYFSEQHLLVVKMVAYQSEYSFGDAGLCQQFNQLNNQFNQLNNQLTNMDQAIEAQLQALRQWIVDLWLKCGLSKDCF